MPGQAFIEHFAAKFANPRNFVAGLVNQKKMEPKKLKYLDFVAYELLMPAKQLPSAQMKELQGMNVDVVNWMQVKDVTNEILSELLVAWRSDYTYEIDGVICANDKVYPRTRGNPEHAFAFKMVLGDQVAEARRAGGRRDVGEVWARCGRDMGEVPGELGQCALAQLGGGAV